MCRKITSKFTTLKSTSKCENFRIFTLSFQNSMHNNYRPKFFILLPAFFLKMQHFISSLVNSWCKGIWITASSVFNSWLEGLNYHYRVPCWENICSRKILSLSFNRIISYMLYDLSMSLRILFIYLFICITFSCVFCLYFFLIYEILE